MILSRSYARILPAGHQGDEIGRISSSAIDAEMAAFQANNNAFVLDKDIMAPDLDSSNEGSDLEDNI